MLKKTKFILYGKPKSKNRPRAAKYGDSVRIYSDQTKEQAHDKSELMRQMRDLGYLQRLREPISVTMRFHMGKAGRAGTGYLNGQPKPTKPDIDNMAKWYLDVMNDLIFDDDRFVTELWCEKLYSVKPKVELYITPIGDKMINEHVTSTKELTIEDLNYMVRKANRLGLRDRQLIRLFMEEDDEGKHYYFECEGLKPPRQDSTDENES